MSIVMQLNPYEFFVDTSGDALDSGYVWIGEVNKDPRNYPVAVFYDEALTIPASMPLRTTNGYIYRNGSPTFLYINGNYSIMVQQKTGVLVYYVPDFMVIGTSAAVSSGDLANQIDPAKGTSLVGWVSPLSNSVGRTLSDKLQDYISVKDVGAKGDGIQNDTPFINNAFEQAVAAKKDVYFPGGTYMLDESSPGSGFCLLNKGVSIIGEGALRTIFVPKANLPNTVDYIMVQPTAATVLDFMEISGFIVYPNASGIKRGKRGMVIDMSAVSNATAVHIDGCYFAPGNDLSLDWVTTLANPQGGPANSLIERSSFWEGLRLVNHGDSISIRNNVFRSSVASGRIGIQSEGINGGTGQPAQLNIHENNFDCNGGAFHAKNGLSGSFTNNNVEQSAGTGTSSGAVVDIDGNATTVGYMDISGNNFGVFGAAAVGQIIRVNNAQGVKIINNRLLSAGPAFAATGILLTSNAIDTTLSGNEISTGVTTPVSDFGVGTRGIQTIVAPINGFTNAGGGAQVLVVYKSPADGRTHVNGSLNCPGGGGSTVVLGNLANGFRPIFTMDIGILALVAGSYQAARLTINTDGSMVLFTTGVATQIFINASFYGNGFVIGNL